jgi:hypothetical protein
VVNVGVRPDSPGGSFPSLVVGGIARFAPNLPSLLSRGEFFLVNVGVRPDSPSAPDYGSPATDLFFGSDRASRSQSRGNQCAPSRTGGRPSVGADILKVYGSDRAGRPRPRITSHRPPFRLGQSLSLPFSRKPVCPGERDAISVQCRGLEGDPPGEPIF